LTVGQASAKDASMPASRFQFERDLLAKQVRRIAGVDEAGRGPLAGPVVAAAVILPIAWIEEGVPRALRGLNDSKQLSASQREDYSGELTCNPEVRFGIASVDVQVIDEINILRATHRAMEAAIQELAPEPEHILVDGLHVRALKWPQTALVSGDARSYSIAAASVLAKVTRDRAMLEFDQQFPQYGFASHKGYGTPQHLALLAEHGPCPIHRRSFAPLRPSEQPELNLFGT
jgi:ribonuclease HII